MADALYRCLGAHGAVSYQSQACTTGQRLDRVVAYQPDAVLPQPIVLTRRSVRQHNRSIRSATRRSSPQRRIQQTSITSNTRCQRAKNTRQQALRRLGLRRRYAQLSLLDVPVREACHGF